MCSAPVQAFSRGDVKFTASASPPLTDKSRAAAETRGNRISALAICREVYR